MSLRELNAATRSRLRVHAWLLATWCVAVGFATSWWLLRAGLRDPMPRYAAAAIVLYSVGLVLGTRVWLAHFSGALAAEPPGAFGRASPSELAMHDAEAAAARRRRQEGRWSVGDWLEGGAWLFELGELSLLLIVPAIAIALAALLLAGGAAPLVLAEGVASLLAEVAVQFVFGALVARRVMRPRAHGEALLTIVGRTWLIGIVLVAGSAATGFLLSWIEPGAASIADLWR